MAGLMALCVAWLGQVAGASEVDSYSGHPETLRDATQAVDGLLNRAVSTAARRANRHDRRRGVCDEAVLYRKLVRQLVGGPSGFVVASRVERRVRHDHTIDQVRTRLKDSIYRDYGVNKLPTIMGGGLASLLAFDDHLVGTDKLGHFVAVGWEYFVRVERRGATLDEALELGLAQERGLFGAATTGVLSYADLSANYNGLLFWQRMVASAGERLDAPFLGCASDGARWEVRERVAVAEYVDASWDERVNPSTFLEPDLAKRANARVEGVLATNPRYPAPTRTLLQDVHPATNPKYMDLPRALAPLAPSLVYP